MDRFLTLKDFPSLALGLHLKSKRLLYLALRKTSGLYLETVVGWILQNFGTESGAESPAVAIVRSQMHAGIPVIPESTQVSFCSILYKKKKKKKTWQRKVHSHLFCDCAWQDADLELRLGDDQWHFTSTDKERRLKVALGVRVSAPRRETETRFFCVCVCVCVCACVCVSAPRTEADWEWLGVKRGTSPLSLNQGIFQALFLYRQRALEGKVAGEGGREGERDMM